MKKAIEGARHFIVVLSIAALNSAWVAREFRHARDSACKVIPLLVPPVDVGVLQWVFDAEPVAIRLPEGPGAVQSALPRLLEALGERLPTD